MSDALPPLREVIARHGIGARRSLGQHFLLDLNLTGRIARSAGDLTQTTIIEIGPGPGGLTRALLEAGARRVVAIERDERCVNALAHLVAAYPDRLRIVAADALEVDLTTLCGPPRKIVANLPYNIGTALLLRWLMQADAFVDMTLMFQREVALRLIATPGTKDYGRLSVFTQWRCRARRLFDIPPSAFTPPPKVHSSVVQLVPIVEPQPAVPAAALERVTAAAFGQRRKMLRSSLKTLDVDVGALLERAGENPTARAEELDVARFGALTEAYLALVGEDHRP